MGLRAWIAIIGICSLTVLSGPRQAAHAAGAAVPAQAPALTAAQLAAVGGITSWDYTYSFVFHDDYANSGGAYISFSGVEVTSWSLEQHFTTTVTATGTVTGPAGCTLDRSAPPADRLPCRLDPALPNHATISVARTLQGQFAEAQGCPGGGAMTDGMFDTSSSYSGSPSIRAPAGSPFGGFALDYGSNPPRGQSDIILDGVSGTTTSTSGGCGTFQTDTNDSETQAGIDFSFGDNAHCCTAGDTQVRVDDRGFLISGRADSSDSVDTCFVPVSPASGIFPCLTTGALAAETKTVSSSWTLRPHVRAGLDVAAIEVNQAVQDWHNSVPLTEGKATIARVFMAWHGETPRTTTALLYGTSGGSPLPGSPLEPMNGTVSATGDVLANRDSLHSSLNYLLPRSWTTGTVTLEVKLAPEDPTQLDCTEAASVPDDCAASVTFAPVSPLQVKLVAITWTNNAPVPQTIVTPYSALAQEAEILRNLLPGATLDSTFGNLDVGVAPQSHDIGDMYAGVNSKLQAMRADDGCGAGCHRIYVGVLTSPDGIDGGEASDIPGVAAAVFFSHAEGNPERNVIAHEVGHNLGRQHDITRTLGFWLNARGGYFVDDSNNPLPLGPCREVADFNAPDYPWFGSFPDLTTNVRSVGVAASQPGLRPMLGPPGAATGDEVWGLDTTAALSGSSVAVLPPNDVFDLMGYCNSLEGRENEWPSASTYTALRDTLNALFPAAHSLRRLSAHRALAQEELVVRGTVNIKTGDVHFDPAALGTAPGPSVTGAYTLEARDGTGGLLANVRLDLRPAHIEGGAPAGFTLSDPTETGTASFIAGVPIGTASLQVRKAGAAVGSALTASAHGPSVSIDSAGFDGAKGTIDVAWSASDVDGDTLRATVEYSPDGSTWQTLGIDVPGSSFSESAAASVGSARARVRVIVSDGLRTATAESAPFAMGNRAPQIAIVAPGPLAAFSAGQAVVLRSATFDAEDGTLRAVRWSADGQSIGTGETLALAAGALDGARCLMASVTDSGGLSSSDQIPLGIGGFCATAPASAPPAAVASPTAPGTAPSTPPSTPPSTFDRPELGVFGAGVVAQVRSRSVTRLTVRLTVKAAATVQLSGIVSGRAIAFQPGSRVAAVVTGRPHSVITAAVGRAGSFPVELLLRRPAKAAVVRLLVTAVGRDGQRTTFALRAIVR